MKEEPNKKWEACEKKSRILLRISWEYREKLTDVIEYGLVKQKQAKIGTNHAPLFADLTGLRINNVF